MKSLLSLFVALPLVVACSSADVGEDDTASTDADLSVASIQGIDIGHSDGFGPPPPPGGCSPFARYSIDFASSALTGEGCIGGKHVSPDRMLSAGELARVRTALKKVKTAPRPDACPTDGPFSSLTVNRASGSTHYVDQDSSCFGGSTPAVSSTLAALLQVVEGMVTAVLSCEQLGGTCQHSPTDVTFPALCGQDFGTATLQGRCGAINQACCAKTHCAPTGILCTLDCPNTGHIGGASCIHGQFDEASCQCELVGP